MQTILAFISSALPGATATAEAAATATPELAATAADTAATAAADAGFSSTAEAVAAQATSAAGWGSKVLGALKVGTSAVSALSTFGQADLQATAMRQEAQDEGLQARNEYVQGAQAANDLSRQYNSLVQQQLAVAGASGIDIGSGSVTDARQQAQQEADRQLTITRGGINMNAAIRMGRAATLRDSASLTQEVGEISGAGKAATAAIGYGRL